MELSKNGAAASARARRKPCGYAVSRSDLIDRVWSEEAAFVEENALSVTVKRLRAKLERDPAHPQWLRTVRGIGYEWGREL